MARRSVCLLMMPSGRKETSLPPGMQPRVVDFDRLWALAFAPLLEELGYDVVRIDQQLGTSAVREMIERLALCDLLVADLSLPDPNVLYEVGVRHAAKEKGCVLIGATWARWPFDAAQLPHIPYPLPSGEVSRQEALAIRKALRGPLSKQHDTVSPCFELKDFPHLEASHTIAFREYLKELARFQKRVIETRLVPDPAERAQRAETLLKRYLGKQLNPALAMELLLLVRDCTQQGWEDELRFLDGLPEDLRNLPTVREQRSHAAARLGDHRQAIAELRRMIEEHGDTAERRALLGQRWRRRYLEAEQARARGERNAAARARRYLAWAIQEYERGMMLDLNDCECLANLPRLLRRRGGPGDPERATRIAHAAMLACERKQLGAPDDDWLRATHLAAAFDAADPASAREGLSALKQRPVAEWLLDATLENLAESLATLPDGPARTQLEAYRDELRDFIQGRRDRNVSRSRPPRDPPSRPSS